MVVRCVPILCVCVDDVAGLWSTTGAADAADSSCKSVGSGELFYATGFPARRTSNTGLDIPANSDVFTIVQNAANASSLVLVHDSATADIDGGAVTLEVMALEAAGTGMDIELFDDKNAQNASGLGGNYYGFCSAASSWQDCHSWDGYVHAGLDFGQLHAHSALRLAVHMVSGAVLLRVVVIVC